MSGRLSVFPGWHKVVAGVIAAWLITCPDVALAQGRQVPPIPTPFPTPDFHFSDPARDAAYWRLEGEKVRAMAVARQSLLVARRAIFRDPARPASPAVPGSPVWRQARVAVEQAIRDQRRARDAMMALIAFVTREGRLVSPAEAQYSLAVRQSEERMILATSENLVDLLAALAGIRIG